MIIKIKNIARRGMSLVLALTMMVPTGVYAGTHNVNSWDGYKEKLKSDIMGQETLIVINFSVSEIFSTEYYARLKISDEYKKAKGELPKHLAELNIKSETTVPVLDGNSNGLLKAVTHTIGYKNSADELSQVKVILNEEYKDIKTKVTDYEKIKAAYDYVIKELNRTDVKENPLGIKEILLPKQNNNAYAVLFAIMMTELGYDNDIATGTGTSNNGHKWNLVKIQGKWYHVDGASEDVGKYEDFLKVKDSEWNIEEHSDKFLGDKLLATEDYIGIPPTVPQLRYEIELLEAEIAKTDKDITNISPESISVAQVRESKEKLKAIEDKIKNYQERKSILEVEVKKTDNYLSLENPFNTMVDNIKDIEIYITAQKKDIVDKAITKAESTFKILDISIAKEALTMVDDIGSVEKINALEKAIVAIEKAEKSKLETDISAARTAVEDTKIAEYKTKLDTRIKELEATIAVEKAEKTRILADVIFTRELVDALSNVDLKTSLGSRLDVVKAEIDANDAEQTRINTATATVDAAEVALKADSLDIEALEGLINTAKAAIINVNTETTKKQLETKLNAIEDAKDVIKKVNDVKASISGAIPALDLEAAVKTAETAVKTIKDTSVKEAQLARIKELKVIIAAIKAVEKAENTLPQKTTYVNAAETAIKNISKISEDYQAIVTNLNTRLIEVKKSISDTDATTKAEMAVQKAEKSMKLVDLNLARDAVGLLPVEKREDLYTRIRATDRVVQAENALAKYLAEPSEDTKSDLDKKIKEANLRVAQLNAEDVNKSKLQDKMKGIVNSKDAIVAIEAVKISIPTEIEADIKKAIEEAENAVGLVTDSRIKKELDNRLKTIVSERDATKKLEEAKKAVQAAEFSLKSNGIDDPIGSNGDLVDNKEKVEAANDVVSKLPTGTDKSKLQATIKELNNAIKAKEAVESAEVKMNNNTLVEKDVTAAEKAVLNINQYYKPGLDDRVKTLRTRLTENESTELLRKAYDAIENAKSTKATTDITIAKKAINLVNDNIIKNELTVEIELLEVEIALDAVEYAEGTRASKDISIAKKSVDIISNKSKYSPEITSFNARIKAMESYIATIKIIENADKNKTVENKSAADSALADFKFVVGGLSSMSPYKEMIVEIEAIMERIKAYLDGEAGKVTVAETDVKAAEDATKVESDASDLLIETAQKTVNLVTDKKIKASLQQRIDAIKTAKYAKLAVAKAEAYLSEKGVKDAETAINKVDGKYTDIIKNLSDRISVLKNKLDVSKKIAEATNLVQKAIESRTETDSVKARFAVDSLVELGEQAKAAYDSLKAILDDLDLSIGNEATNQEKAIADARTAIDLAFDKINSTNEHTVGIIEGEIEEVDKIQEAYKMIESAKIEIIRANAAVRKLTEQKELLAEIDYANIKIDLAEDNVDVKAAVRLTTIASSSVLNATTEVAKSKARLDIAAARRAIDKIGHINNKAIKTTILNTVNSIEKKLVSDNDQELIDIAILAVNDAADLLAKAVRENKVTERQEQIDKAIFAAKMAIGWISDNNKDAKSTLTGFINEIEAMYKAEKEGILNEDRIKRAEEAVVYAESLIGKESLDDAIRTARLRVNIIRNDGIPDTKAKIDELNLRLDALEIKTGGGPGTGGGSGSGGNNSGGSTKPGGDTTPINVIPTTPLPDSKRVIGTTEPIWGKTKELKKANATSGLSIQEMTAFRVNEGKLKTMELSNMLKTTPSANARLVIRGKNIKLDSKPYINDKVNNSILLPIKTLGDELGLAISLIDSPVGNGSKRLLVNGFINGASKSIIMDIGSEYCYINGYLVKLSSKPLIQDGRAYIPVDFMVEHLGVTFSYYIEGGTIQLIVN